MKRTRHGLATAPGDLQATFREYMSLERKREKGALQVEELRRWTQLKAQLNRRFQPDLREETECRRQSIRVPTRLDVAFETAGELRESLMTNLSRGGLFVSTASPLEIGAKIELNISVRELGRPVSVGAEVVSQNVGRDMLSAEPGMGLRFVDLDEEQRAAVDALYRYAATRAIDRLESEEAS